MPTESSVTAIGQQVAELVPRIEATLTKAERKAFELKRTRRRVSNQRREIKRLQSDVDASASRYKVMSRESSTYRNELNEMIHRKADNAITRMEQPENTRAIALSLRVISLCIVWYVGATTIIPFLG